MIWEIYGGERWLWPWRNPPIWSKPTKTHVQNHLINATQVQNPYLQGKKYIQKIPTIQQIAQKPRSRSKNKETKKKSKNKIVRKWSFQLMRLVSSEATRLVEITTTTNIALRGERKKRERESIKRREIWIKN